MLKPGAMASCRSPPPTSKVLLRSSTYMHIIPTERHYFYRSQCSFAKVLLRSSTYMHIIPTERHYFYRSQCSFAKPSRCSPVCVCGDTPFIIP